MSIMIKTMIRIVAVAMVVLVATVAILIGVIRKR